MLTRRSLLAAPAVALAAQADTPLGQRAAKRNVLFGAAATWPALRNDAAYAEHFAKECAILVPENVLKMGPVQPARGNFNFEAADFMADFCVKHNMKMRGHTLVWHSQMSPWFRTEATSENSRAILEEHIRAVAGRFKGRMHSWDVVNEAIQVSDGLPGGLRKTPWLSVFGPEYIDLSFRLAREADPSAMLCYNDYGLDYDTPGDGAKRAAVLALVRGMLDRKVPLDAVGTQAHLSADRQKNFKPEVIERFFKDISALGLKILITELDVVDRDLPDDIELRDKGVAECYEAYLAAAHSNKDMIAVLTWGLTDKYTWLANRNRRPSGAPVRVLPLDRDFGRKPAWHAMAKVFDSRA